MGSLADIQLGWDVYGSDNEKIGTVDVLGDDYLEVEKGYFFLSDVFIPASAVREVDSTTKSVVLSASRDAVGNMGWTEPPARTADTNESAARTWGQGTIDGGTPAPDRPAEREWAEPEPAGLEPADREPVGAGADRAEATRFEEPKGGSSDSVPREAVDGETMEMWSPIGEDRRPEV